MSKAVQRSADILYFPGSQPRLPFSNRPQDQGVPDKSGLSARELEIVGRERLEAAREAGSQAASGAFARTFIEPIRLAMRRRRTLAELSRLDDRLLADIGLERGSLDLVAVAMTNRGASRHRKSPERRRRAREDGRAFAVLGTFTFLVWVVFGAAGTALPFSF